MALLWSHTIVILTLHPLKNVLKNQEIVGSLAYITILLGEHDIKFMPKSSIKAQAITNFTIQRSGAGSS